MMMIMIIYQLFKQTSDSYLARSQLSYNGFQSLCIRTRQDFQSIVSGDSGRLILAMCSWQLLIDL